MIAAFVPEHSVAAIHSHYVELIRITRECNLTLPPTPMEWPGFWSDLCNNMIGRMFPISFHHLRMRHQAMYKVQQELARVLLTQCRDWHMIQDEYEYSFDLLKYLSPRKDYLGVVNTIWMNPTITQEILGAPSHTIGHFLVWKHARNMLCHKSSRENQDFFYSLDY